MASPAPSALFNEKPLLVRNPSGSGSARSRKHNPILPFHKQVIKELASPEEDDLLVMAKGLGMRRASHAYIRILNDNQLTLWTCLFGRSSHIF